MPLCVLQTNWALGALIVEVLKAGGKAISKAHEHPYIASAGSNQGVSDATAAATAVGFCLLLLFLMSCAAHLKVGISSSTAATSATAARLSSPSDSLSPVNGASGMGSAIGGVPQPAGPRTGVQSSVKYQRIRVASPTDGASSGLNRQGVASSWSRSGGDGSGGGMNGVMMTNTMHLAGGESRLSGSLNSTLHEAKHR